MTIVRMQLATYVGDTLPKSACVITPHFRVTGVDEDIQQLTDDLVAGWKGWLHSTYTNTQIICKAYDAEKSPPNYPIATSNSNLGAAAPVGVPLEVAIALSFFSEHNRPRRRGRLYIPATFATLGISGGQVSLADRNKVAALVPIFTGLGGLNVDWIVWSRRDANEFPVTNWFVDDAWDTVRSRGRPATTRTSGTTTEGTPP
jgi:hypothetical protein